MIGIYVSSFGNNTREKGNIVVSNSKLKDSFVLVSDINALEGAGFEKLQSKLLQGYIEDMAEKYDGILPKEILSSYSDEYILESIYSFKSTYQVDSFYVDYTCSKDDKSIKEGDVVYYTEYGKIKIGKGGVLDGFIRNPKEPCHKAVPKKDVIAVNDLRHALQIYMSTRITYLSDYLGRLTNYLQQKNTMVVTTDPDTDTTWTMPNTPTV